MTDNTKRGTDAAQYASRATSTACEGTGPRNYPAAPTASAPRGEACKTCGGSRVVERAFSSTSYGNAPCMDCASAIGQQANWRAYALNLRATLERGYKSLASASMARTRDGEAAWAAMGDALALAQPVEVKSDGALINEGTMPAHLSATNSGTEGEAPASNDKTAFPRVLGVGRDAESPGGKGVLVSFENEPTDDELRAFHAAIAPRGAA
jgi:hypothetical protein